MYIKKFNPMMLLVLISLAFTQFAFAEANANKLNTEVDLAIKKFKKDVPGGEKFLTKVKGYLVFPSVYKGGFIIGGKYGKGALRVNGVTKYFYSMASASIGYQAGVQEHAVLGGRPGRGGRRAARHVRSLLPQAAYVPRSLRFLRLAVRRRHECGPG